MKEGTTAIRRLPVLNFIRKWGSKGLSKDEIEPLWREVTSLKSRMSKVESIVSNIVTENQQFLKGVQQDLPNIVLAWTQSTLQRILTTVQLKRLP